MIKTSRKNAKYHGRKGVDGWYYQLPEFNNGTTIAYAEFTGEHGERTIGERSRMYYILEGAGEALINGDKFELEKDDVLVIPPYATFNLWPKNGKLKVVLFMELLDLDKLPKK